MQLARQNIAGLGADDERFHHAGGFLACDAGGDAVTVKVDGKEHDHQDDDACGKAGKPHRPQRQRRTAESGGSQRDDVLADAVLCQQGGDPALLERVDDADRVGQRPLIKLDEGRSLPLDHLDDER